MIIAADLHNAHMYYLLVPNLQTRNVLIEKLKRSGIQPVFHYVPLHSSPAGLKYGRAHGDMSYTDKISDCLVRLPFWIGMTEDDLGSVVRAVSDVLG